ncbi:protein lifeguard 3-like [Maniola jurtina]|uniref:protein lifeguard 3-like n=1 Tax=Maniola jurtina TaxID=191418 RepID=UPI001E68C5AA|nr:protein lifeguard 3-like [Maniola jurtina]
MIGNTERSVELIELEDKLNKNEEAEIIINIGEIPIVNKVAKQFVKFTNITEQNSKENTKKNSKELTYAIETEKQDNIDQQSTVIELVDKQRKTPNVWVQFQQEVKDGPGKQIDVGRQNGPGGRNYQYSQYYHDQGGVGVPLDYNPETRNGFVMLVFTIVLVMLALTFLYVVFVLNTPSVLEFYQIHRRPLAFLSAGVMITLSYAMVCCLPCMRVAPCNYIVLFIAVAAMSNLAAVGTAIVQTHIIMFALLATSVTVAICLLLAMSKFDFTAWYLYILVIGVVLMVLSLGVSIASIGFGIYFKPLVLAILYISTIFQIIVLVMELQMILGGKSIEISEEDYALAAYMLYTSIVNLFLQILQILANLDSD